jgi:MoaA/NifB/PqqE/SkfB family radical SAM enzyme
MSEELLFIVKKNCDKLAKELSIGFFGEPLLHPSFNNFVALMASENSYKLSLNTNWSLVTEKNMNVLNNFDEVRINLDTIDSFLYDKMCPGNVLDINGNVSHNRLDAISEKLDHWLSIPNHTQTRIVYTTSSFNENEREDFVRLWVPKLNKQDYVLTKSIISYGGIIQDRRITSNDCMIHDLPYFVAAWNGDCTSCNLDVDIALKGGNLYKYDDIETIYETNVWRENLKKIEEKRGICSKCVDANNWSENEIYMGMKDD